MVERLHEEFVGVLNRSILPGGEKSTTERRQITKELLRDLYNLSGSIESCGYNCSTFQVNVNTKEISEELNGRISDIMKSHSISKYSIVSSGIQEFSACRVGQRVNVEYQKGKYKSGTLGGFAKTSSDESEQRWAILSRHVARYSIDRKLYLGNDSMNPDYCGEIMKELMEEVTNKQYLDIAAAALDKPIDTRYVTEDGKLVPGKLCRYDPEKLRGLNVHIKGATSSLGLGVITMPEQFSVKSDNLDENYIVVEDRDQEKAFAQEGDSGAIVVAENPDNYGEEVQLISMVMGERVGQKGSYTTVRLDKGLEQLKSLTDKDFSMC